jgi:hypothetical protein
MTREAAQDPPEGNDEKPPAADADVRWSRRARRTVAISQIVVAIAQAADVVLKIFT